MREASTMDELIEVMDKNRGMVRTNWCGSDACAKEVDDKLSAEIKGYREDIKEEPYGDCIVCGKEGKHVAYIASSY